MQGKWSVYILLVAAILSALLLAGLGPRTASASATSSLALQDDAEEPDEDEEVEDDLFEERADNPFCENYELTHPVADRLAQIYDVEYEAVMDWFCRGFGFGQIMLALQTALITEDGADTLLGRRQAGEGWGQIWRDQGLIGRRANAGPPDHAGRPDDTGPPPGAGPPGHAGRPEHAGPPPHAGPPDNAGRADDAGRRDDVEPPDDDSPPADAGPPGDATAPDDGVQPAEGGEVYVVQPGDRLADIAATFGVELEILAEANNIDNINHIEVGQVLTIPR